MRRFAMDLSLFLNLKAYHNYATLVTVVIDH